MKIEMGESLFYSWLRHVKECQIVQTNWKVSSQWTFSHADEIEQMLQEIDTYFEHTYNYKVFKKNTSLSQIIQQGECDVLGVCFENKTPKYYAVDVAFHEAGLNYGTREETVLKVIAKSIRTAFCLYGYFDAKDGDIVFASPKINKAILNDIEPLIEYINKFFEDRGFFFNIRVICNEEFEERILKPILLVSGNVADTSELFMRAYQLFAMFADTKMKPVQTAPTRNTTAKSNTPKMEYSEDAYSELKVGKLAQTVLVSILESGTVSDEEIALLQTVEYSKKTFDLQFPLLVLQGVDFPKMRYYSKSITIKGDIYYLCSQWFEVSANNDRPFLLNWIEKHSSTEMSGCKIDKQMLYQLLLTIPHGKVVTYGTLAELLGDKTWARAVGNALHENPDGDKYPCYKVVNSRGELSHAYVFGGIEEQKRRLEADGIKIENGKVDITRYGYFPDYK